MVEDIDAETPLTVLTFQRCARTGFWGHQKPISNRLYQPQAILSRWYDKFILWFRISKLVIFLLTQIRSNKLIECFRMFSLKIRIIYWIAILLVMNCNHFVPFYQCNLILTHRWMKYTRLINLTYEWIVH